VSAFSTHSLAGGRWEVDELAVRPVSQGLGVGTRLIARALSTGAQVTGLSQARALVATDNLPSRRVFVKSGFAPIARVELLLYEISGRVPRPEVADHPSVRVARATDAPAIRGFSGCPTGRVVELLRRADSLYWVAESAERVRGYVELIHVRTLQYEGLWIESIAVEDGDRATAEALFTAALEEAKRREAIDEVGYLASPENRVMYSACVGQGFRKVNEYQVFTRGLS
jgi:GNAT superfamily N-acetyltransferase